MGVPIAPPVCDTIKSKGTGHVRIPPTLSSALARLLGLLTAEGVNRRTTQVRFVNTDPAISRDFADLVQQVFGLRVFAADYKRPGCTDSIVFSAVLGRLLDRAFGFAIDSCSADKVIAPQLFGAEPEAQWAFLSGLFEGDAYISVGASRPPYLELTTASPKLAQQTGALLLRLAIFAVIRSTTKYATNTVARRRRQYHSVFVYGSDQLHFLAANLSFVGAKQAALDALQQLPIVASNPNLDLVPDATPLVREAAKLAGINIKRHRVGRPKLAAYVEGRCQASRRGLSEVSDQIEELGATPESAQDHLRTLRRLASSDVYWDTVVAIDEITPSDPWVYDLCVDETHNFVANNVIVHNSNIADGVLWVLGEQSAKAVR
ncbi:MAG TPA: LAGLIDADG family homing endonuclease, partial [Planctomycetaceae bacterium]|nr:LAGLIDADG family homing endonuclease [Planctomycetaceae bacterium]